jgi:hypothetical protein
MRLKPPKRPQGRNRPAPQGSGVVFSYRSARSESVAKSQGRHEVGKPSLLRRLPRYILLIVALVVIGFTSTLTPNPVITSFSSESDAALLRSPDVYQDAAARILSNSLLDHSKITIDSSGFESQMKAEFPELSEAALTLPFLSRRPLVTLVAVKPVLSLTSQQGIYLLDQTGTAIIKATDVASLSHYKLQVLTDETNLPVGLGKGVLTSQEVVFIQVLTAQLQAGGLNIQTISLPSTINELHIRVIGQPYYIKFDMGNDPRTSAGAYMALKQYLDTNHIVPSQYADLRLDERAVYK